MAGTEIPFTTEHSDLLAEIATDIRITRQGTERRLLDLEGAKEKLHGRITKEADKSEARDASLHSRVNSTKFISVGVSAVFGFLGGLIGLPIKGTP